MHASIYTVQVCRQYDVSCECKVHVHFHTSAKQTTWKVSHNKLPRQAMLGCMAAFGSADSSPKKGWKAKRWNTGQAAASNSLFKASVEPEVLKMVTCRADWLPVLTVSSFVTASASSEVPFLASSSFFSASAASLRCLSASSASSLAAAAQELQSMK